MGVMKEDGGKMVDDVEGVVKVVGVGAEEDLRGGLGDADEFQIGSQ